MLPIKPINPYYLHFITELLLFLYPLLFMWINEVRMHQLCTHKKYVYNFKKVMNRLKQVWFYSSFVQSHLFDFSFFLSWTSSYYAFPGLCPQNRLFLPLSRLASCLVPLPSIFQMVTRWSFQSIKNHVYPLLRLLPIYGNMLNLYLAIQSP